MSSFLDVGWPLLTCRFTDAELPQLRYAVAAGASDAGLAGVRFDDFVLAVHEAAVNAVRHGGGAGRLRLWRNATMLCCQISDDGPGAVVGETLGAAPPALDSTGGRGMWLIHRLADEVSIHSSARGTLLWIAFRLAA